MPDRALTDDQRNDRPWGLPPDVLKACKVITDPVHGDIHLNWLEVAILDSPPCQRLRRVRQLGTTHLVYPGATHSRFSHSLGAVRVAQRLLDQIITQREGLHAVEDLFTQWWTGHRESYNRDTAEAIVLARLGALTHDLCHVPVGHSVEDDLGVLESHDHNEDRFKDLWTAVAARVLPRIESTWKDDAGKRKRSEVEGALFTDEGELYRELVPLIVSKKKVGKEVKPRTEPRAMKYPFVADVVGNTICADLLDYLVRDHLFTGLPASIGNRFISAFYVVPSGRGPFSRRMALNIMRQEHERSDVVSELLKALRYRYELSERALAHHAKLAADAMLGEALERWAGALWLEQAAMNGLEAVPAHEAHLAAADVYPLKKLFASSHGEKAADTVQDAVRESLEREFLKHGDDGLLERMSARSGDAEGAPEPVADSVRRLLGHSAALADALLRRDLFRIAGRVGAKDAPAEALFDEYGDAAERDKLERDAERFAELGAGDPPEDGIQPRVVIWLPRAGMRLKLAEVLVRHRSGVTPFVDYERTRSGRGSDIYDAHARLWACYVFVRRDVTPEDEKVVTTYLAREMGVRWERHREFGPRPSEWPDRLAIHRELGHALWNDADTDRVLKAMESVSARDGKTFADLRVVAREARDSAGTDTTGGARRRAKENHAAKASKPVARRR